jgi:hypothetical protein
MNLPVLSAALIAATALGSASPPSALREQAEDRVRSEIGDLIRALCPEQCVLLSVRAAVEEQPATGPDLQPGFQALSPAGRYTTLRSVGATVLLDQQLPQPFRARFRQLAADRLAGLGAPVTVDTQSVRFPPRNAPHLEAQPQQPAQPPAPQPAAALAPAGPQAAPVLPAAQRAADQLIDHAPIIVLALLFSLVAIALGVLLLLAVRSLRRQTPDAFYDDLPGGDPGSASGFAGDAAAALSPARSRKLEKALVEERVLRNEVLRSALGRGEVSLVASWLREFGEFLLADLRGDSALAAQLAQLGVEVARPEAPGVRARGLQELEGRLLSLRLRRPEDSADHAFDFLEGVQQDRFAGACTRLSEESLEVALRFAPPHLRAHALTKMPAEVRQALALSWVRRADVNAATALAAADELRARLDETSAGSDQRDSALADLLDALSRAEQDELLERLSVEGGRGAAEGLLGESALLVAPPEALGAVVLATPPQRVLAYLSGTDKVLRERLLAACPPRLRAELLEELSARTPASRDEFLAARRQFIGNLKEECARRGLSLTVVRSARALDPHRSVAALGPR